MTRKKVAFISHSCIESSSRTKLAYLGRHAELRLITPSWFPTPFGKYEVDYKSNPDVAVESYRISFLNVKRTTTRWFLFSRDLGFSQFQPDIIHVENECHSWIVCQALLYRKMFAPQAKMVVFSWDNLHSWELGIKHKTLEHLAAFNRHRIDFFIMGNSAGREILLAKGVPSQLIEVIPQFGVDPETFFPLAYEQRQVCREQLGIRGEFAVGYVGKLIEEKGLFDLIEALGQLRETSHGKIALLVMGKGELEQAIRSRCTYLGLKLVLLPARKNDEVAHVMNAMDVLVLPTYTRPPIKEQFGRVLIEAMACGVPVIGSDCGEIPNVIGDAGLVFPERRSKELAECLALCGNENFRLQLRARGLDRVLKNYTNEKIADRTLKIYQRVSQSPVPSASSAFALAP
jgi:glycosyltransferase involved in cell wall biosynthesis